MMSNVTNCRNTVFGNVGYDASNSLVHLLDDDELSSIKLSPFIDVDAFTKKLNENKSRLSLLCLNIASIGSKFDEFKFTIDQINEGHQVSVICIQETWLGAEDDLDMYQLDNYTLISKGKYCSKHGGLIIYVHTDFECRSINIVDDYIATTTNDVAGYNTIWEHLFIEIKHKTSNSKKYIIGNIYRVPNELIDRLDRFIVEFTETLSILQRTNRTVYVCGDTNINLLKIHEKKHYNMFFDSVLSSGFYPRINLPTRFDKVHGSASLIDQIFTNELNENDSGVFTNEISDHQMIYTMCKSPTKKVKEKTMIDIETSNPASLEHFLTALRNENIVNQINQNPFANPNTNYNIFIKLLTDIKEKVIPRKRVKFNKNKHKKSPWMTYGIIKSINAKDKLYKKVVQNTPDANDQYYAK